MQQSESQWSSACSALMAGNIFAKTHNSADSAETNTETGSTFSAPEQMPGNASASEVTISPEAEPIPSDLNHIFIAQRQMYADIQSLVKKQQDLETNLLGRSLTAEVSSESQLKMAAEAIRQLVKSAQDRFAPPGGTLSIDDHQMCKDLGIGDWETQFHNHTWRRSKQDPEREVEEFVDLNMIAKYLEDTYDGDAGKKQAYSQAAKRLISFFGLSQDDSVKRSKNGVTMTARVWSQYKDYGTNKGLYEPSMSSGSRYEELRAFGTFLGQCELDSVRSHQFMSADFFSYNFAFKPREKRSFSMLEISFFKEKWEFRFAEALAEQLMLFLGEWGCGPFLGLVYVVNPKLSRYSIGLR